MPAAPSRQGVPEVLKKIDSVTAKHLDVHLVCDNDATHKTPAVMRWLAKNTRFKMHFTPTSASWLDVVERFFADITENAIRRGVLESVAELEAAISINLAVRNAEPTPFVWTKSADVMLTKVDRAGAKLNAVKNRNRALASERKVMFETPTACLGSRRSAPVAFCGIPVAYIYPVLSSLASSAIACYLGGTCGVPS